MAFYLHLDGVNDYLRFAEPLPASTSDGTGFRDSIRIKFRVHTIGGDSYIRLLSSNISGNANDRIILEANGDRLLVNAGSSAINAFWSGLFPSGLPLNTDIEILLKTVYGSTNKELFLNGVSKGVQATQFQSLGRWYYAGVNFDQYAGIDILEIERIDEHNSANNFRCTASSSSHGTGTPVLNDEVNNYDLTGYNMLTDGSAWINIATGVTAALSDGFTLSASMVAAVTRHATAYSDSIVYSSTFSATKQTTASLQPNMVITDATTGQMRISGLFSANLSLTAVFVGGALVGHSLADTIAFSTSLTASVVHSTALTDSFVLGSNGVFYKTIPSVVTSSYALDSSVAVTKHTSTLLTTTVALSTTITTAKAVEASLTDTLFIGTTLTAQVVGANALLDTLSLYAAIDAHKSVTTSGIQAVISPASTIFGEKHIADSFISSVAYMLVVNGHKNTPVLVSDGYALSSTLTADAYPSIGAALSSSFALSSTFLGSKVVSRPINAFIAYNTIALFHRTSYALLSDTLYAYSVLTGGNQNNAYSRVQYAYPTLTYNAANTTTAPNVARVSSTQNVTHRVVTT